VSIDFQTLHQSNRGSRCFFLGNGPSLKAIDLRLLESEQVWVANRAYLLFDRIRWRPSFYVVRDPYVIENSLDQMRSLVISLPGTIFFFPDCVRESGLMADQRNVCWYRELEKTTTDHPRFSFDADVGVVRSSTVAVTVLQLAVWMRFDPIILLGCDMSYEARKSGGEETFQPVQGADSDHFDRSYLDGGARWQVPDVAAMFADFEAARQACDSRGVTVFNATDGGKLEVFPRIRFVDIAGRGDAIK